MNKTDIKKRIETIYTKTGVDIIIVTTSTIKEILYGGILGREKESIIKVIESKKIVDSISFFDIQQITIKELNEIYL